MNAKSEFERRLRRILKEQRLAKVDCYCQNWEAIELRDALLTRLDEVINDARHDFPPLGDLTRLLQQLDLGPDQKSEKATHARAVILQTRAALAKWFPPDPPTRE